MPALFFGLVFILMTAVLFWRWLPRNGKVHPVMTTSWEPMIGVGITSGIALGATLMLLGLSQIIG